MENYVYQALRRAGYHIYVGKMQNAEIDFVCIRHDQRLYVQSSWTLDDDSTAKREYKALDAIPDSYPKLIVTMDDIPRMNYNGIENVQAWKLEERLMALTR